MDRKWILTGAAAVAALVGCYWIFRHYLDGTPPRIQASGTIETTEVDVSFQVAGVVRELRADEGDKVCTGQVLAVLDLEPLRRSLERAEAAVEGARAAAAQQRPALELTRKTVLDQEKVARAALEAAQARHLEAKTGPRVQEVRQAEAALDGAEAALTKARADAGRARELVRRQVYSKAALDSAEAALVSAQSERDRAAEALKMIREGTRREEIEGAEAQVRQARALLDQAAANWLQLDIRRRDLESADARTKELEAAARLARINLEYGEMKAPRNGWILLKNIEAGEVVNVGTPVFTLGDIEDLWINVYVPETSVGRLRLGDPVEIEVDAHPGERFTGRIVFISQEAEFTPRNIQTREERTKLVYRVKVAIRNLEQKLKPGMPADAVLPLR